MVSIAALFLWASGPAADPEAFEQKTTYGVDPVPERDTLTVLTWNIGYLSGMRNNLPYPRDCQFYSNNLDSAKKYLRDIAPDFIAFQEIDVDSYRSCRVHQSDNLGQELGFFEGVTALNWNKRYLPFPYWPPSAHYRRVVSGQAILSRFPIRHSDKHVLQPTQQAPSHYRRFYLDRLAQVALIDIGKQDTLALINVHLEAFDPPAREIQALEVAKLYRTFQGRYPVLLIGDFNAHPPSKWGTTSETSEESTIPMLLSQPLLRSAIDPQVYLSDPERFYTFSSERPVEMIDYIFYSSDRITLLDARVCTEVGTASDHLPVWMRFVVLR